MVLVFYNISGEIVNREFSVSEVLFDRDNNRFYFSKINDKKSIIEPHSLKLDDYYHNFKVDL